MSITSFTYRSNLNLVYKESLSRIAAFLGVPVSKSAGKPTMIEKIDSYVKSNPIEVLEKLCVKELELLREFVKAGPDTPVVKVPLGSVLKKARKKAKELVAEPDMPVIHPSKTEIDDFDGMLRRRCSNAFSSIFWMMTC